MKKNRDKALAAILGVLLVVGFTNALKIAYPLRYKDSICKFSKEYDVDPLLVLSIMKAESKFFPYAKSKKDAKGLMQILDATYDFSNVDIERKQGLYDIDTNIKVGCWYIHKLYNQFEDEDLVIMSYNAGPGNVGKWLKNDEYSNDGKRIKKIPFGETKVYLARVKKNYKIYKLLYGKISM